MCYPSPITKRLHSCAGFYVLFYNLSEVYRSCRNTRKLNGGTEFQRLMKNNRPISGKGLTRAFSLVDFQE